MKPYVQSVMGWLKEKKYMRQGVMDNIWYFVVSVPKELKEEYNGQR